MSDQLENAARAIEDYAEAHHVHVDDGWGGCWTQADRCDITAAYRHAAAIVRGAK